MISQRLEELSITLPGAPKPVASYVPTRSSGDLIHVSGQIPMRDGTLIATGSVPNQVSEQRAVECARQCTLNALACLNYALGDLDRIERFVRIGVFVASAPDYYDHPKVANGCSDLLFEIFGETGRHARAAVGVSALPLGAPVEIEMTVKVKD